MGAEAGQDLSEIIERKELERYAGGGYFAWGIGNSLGRAVSEAQQALEDRQLEVLFTPMRSAAKAADKSPGAKLLWLAYQGIDGVKRELPGAILLTSRGDPKKKSHYALLCYSASRINVAHDNLPSLDVASLANFRSRNPIGSSQVTAVVRRTIPHWDRASSSNYQVAFKAEIAGDGFAKLLDPVRLRGSLHDLYLSACRARDATAWLESVQALKREARSLTSPFQGQASLFTEA